jgi:hypothetical protein
MAMDRFPHNASPPAGSRRRAGTVAPPIVHEVLQAPGQPLDAETRKYAEPKFGHDFSGVRLHTDARAAESARAVMARAYSVGSHIVFGRGEYHEGSAGRNLLLAHELTHVTQQRRPELRPSAVLALDSAADSEGEADTAAGLVAAGQPVQVGLHNSAVAVRRAISPDDVSMEMVGRQFTLTEDSGNLKAGDLVTVMAWDNNLATVTVSTPKLKANVDVAKRIIRPATAALSDIAPYSAASDGVGVDAQARAVARREKKLINYIGKEPEYRTAEQRAEFSTEKANQEKVLGTSRATLNSLLIQQTMFNRFDEIIKREVDSANKAHGLRGAAALDPNMFKSMIFHESQMGTSGPSMYIPAREGGIASRFNLAQVIVSSGMALFTLMEREQPTLMKKYSLTGLRSDLNSAKDELKNLEKKPTRTPAEDARLVELKELKVQSWETFIWNYHAPGATEGFSDAVAALFASTKPPRNEDYEFWIHLALMWLFEKHSPGESWPHTIRDYNAGNEAEMYRDTIVKRAKNAKDALKHKKEFFPER